jgi:hypothetical protein
MNNGALPIVMQPSVFIHHHIPGGSAEKLILPSQDRVHMCFILFPKYKIYEV